MPLWDHPDSAHAEFLCCSAGHTYGHHGEDLFPPPPPRGAKGPGAAYPEDRSRGAEADPEREAFNAELDKLASEMEKVSHT